MRRVRRPLLALIALIVALIIGYTVRAFTSSDSAGPPDPTPSIVRSMTVQTTGDDGGMTAPGSVRALLPVRAASE